MASITGTLSKRNLPSNAGTSAKSSVNPSSSYVNSYQADVSAYKLHISSVSMSAGQFEGSLSLDFAVRDTTTVPGFFNDMNTMNKIKGSNSDAVKKHYAELLTLLALSTEEKDK